MHLAAKLALAGFVPVSLLAGRTWLGSPCCLADRPDAAQAAAEEAVNGRYVEARSASVFAGACHFGAEYTTQGREAVLAWQLAGGRVDGESLEGVELVAVVTAEDNLAEADAARASVVYLDAELPEAVRAAALAWLEREHGEVLGTVGKVETAEVRVDCAGERYVVSVPGRVRLEGEALPDRACCSMPSNVWYSPLVALEGRVVGQSQVLEVSDPDVGPAFVRRWENDAFLGALPAPAADTCSSQVAACGAPSEPSCCAAEGSADPACTPARP
jgi:hypothetical protein